MDQEENWLNMQNCFFKQFNIFKYFEGSRFM